MHGWRDADGAEIVAICDRDPERLQDRRRPVRHRAALHRRGGDDGERRSSTSSTSRPPSAATGRWSSWPPRTSCRRSAKSRSRRRSPTPRPWSTACRKAGVPLMVHENFRWQSPIQAVKQVLDAGEIGEPFFGRISFRSGFDVFSGQPYLAEGEALHRRGSRHPYPRHRALPARRRRDAHRPHGAREPADQGRGRGHHDARP